MLTMGSINAPAIYHISRMTDGMLSRPSQGVPCQLQVLDFRQVGDPQGYGPCQPILVEMKGRQIAGEGRRDAGRDTARGQRSLERILAI